MAFRSWMRRQGTCWPRAFSSSSACLRSPEVPPRAFRERNRVGGCRWKVPLGFLQVQLLSADLLSSRSSFFSPKRQHHKKYQHVHQKTFTCSEPSCGKSFNFKKHLKEHEKLHSDKRDYICEFCARSFRTSSNLIIHRRIHTGEKPLQCEICGFTCRQKASLNWHMKKHDADSFYQFSCDICGKKFEKKDNVTAHKSKSHPEVPGGPPQGEGGQRQTAPSPPLNFSAGMRAGLEHPEAPGALATEPLELPGLGDTLAGGGEPEKTPPPIAASAEYRGGLRQDPDVPRGRVMDGVGS